METVIESVRAWPEWLGAIVLFGGMIAYGFAGALVIALWGRQHKDGFVSSAIGVLWPLTLLWWLASYPLRRLGRWWRGRREHIQQRECEAACWQRLSEQRPDLKDAFTFRQPAPSDGDLPPYGARVPEDAKPVRREEYENDIRAQDAVNESLEARVAALEDQMATVLQKAVALESARAGEGVRAFDNHGLIYVCVDGVEVGMRDRGGQWITPDPIGRCTAGELHGMPCARELSAAEALALDAERRQK